jgi:hypothetical protein
MPGGATAKFKRNSQPKLLGDIEEIVRRGRVRGIIPWLITQRPAVLVQADIQIAIKLPTSQDRDAVAALIEGQTDRAGEARASS